MEKFRYYLTDQMGTLATEPLGASDFVIVWSSEVDGSMRMFTKTFDGNIKFTGAAYKKLIRLEKSIYRCNTQNLTIEKNCNNSWEQIFSGSISLNSGEWDEDNCSVKLKFTEENSASCLQDNDGEAINLLDINPKYQLNTTPGNITLEYEFYNLDDVTAEEPPAFVPYWGGDPEDEANGWTYYRHFENLQKQSGNPGDWVQMRRTNWVREVLLSAVPVTDDPSWIAIGMEAGQYKYARRVVKYNEVWSEEQQGENWITDRYEADFLGKQGTETVLRNGVKFSDVLQLFVDTFCPGLTIKSDFFQINPENESLINYVTGKASKVNNLFLFQASDVKRPTATGWATKLIFDWERLTAALKNMFNVDWRVENGVLILEHVSFFPKVVGMDLTVSHRQYLNRKYTYKNDSIPSKELWKWASDQSAGDFNGLPITYNSGCIVNKRQEKTYPIEDVYTDVQLAISNSAADSKVVNDEGVFFVAAGFDGTNYYVLQEPGILSAPRVNNTLALAQLHRDYHRYERHLPVGTMNGVLTEFITVKPTKQGNAFKIPFCCPTDFKPDDMVKTLLGDGVVNTATYSFRDSMLELELLYDSFADLEENTEPVAVWDNVNLYDNETTVIDVLANDTFEPGDTIEIVTPPAIGTATVVDNKIQFFVNLGALGQTYLTYRIKDSEWNVYSDPVTVAINILGANQPPVANTDTYQAVKDTVLNISAAQGVLANDTDDYGGLFVASFDAVSANGAAIVMQPNGSFSYTPVSGFTGSDSFGYVVEDDGGLQDSGVVNISVDQENVPITVNDIYAVQIGASLNVDNSTYKPGLLNNDYTLDASPISAVAESKTTTRGQTAVISANGSFAYTAPATPGDDGFDYTAVGTGGNSQGAAIIKVLPVIRVGLTLINQDVEFREIDCDNTKVEGIREDTAGVQLFFVDENNDPVDVTGMGLKVMVKNTYTDLLNSQSSSGYSLYSVSGTSQVILANAVIYYRESNCQTQVINNYSYEYNVEPFDGYTAI